MTINAENHSGMTAAADSSAGNSLSSSGTRSPLGKTMVELGEAIVKGGDKYIDIDYYEHGYVRWD